MTGRSQSATTADHVSEAQLTTLRQRREDAESRLASLTAANATQQQMRGRFGKPEDVALIEEVRRLEHQRSALRLSRVEAVSKVAASQQAVATAAAALDQSESREKDLEIKAAEAEAALAKEVAFRTTTAKLPRQRVSSKREVGVLVGNGRLYCWHRYGPDGEQLEVNTDDLKIRGDKGAVVKAELKPNGGVPIAEGADADRQMRDKLSSFDPKRMYIAVAIWEDSFAQFQHLKKTLVDLGFEYRLIPLEETGAIYEHSGSGGNVQ